MSLANLQVSGQGEAASLDYSTVFRMYVQAPVTEELLFRLCMLYFAYSAYVRVLCCAVLLCGSIAALGVTASWFE